MRQLVPRRPAAPLAADQVRVLQPAHRAVVQPLALPHAHQHLAENAEYVGIRFPEEVRRMHDNDEPQRHVWGEATAEEARDLLDDGIPVLPVPALPEELD